MLAFLDHYGIADDDPRVNQYGGAIAYGHPLASSGVRLMTQLARQFEEQPQVRYGLTTMCVGFGMGAHGHLGEPALRRRQQVSTTAELLKGAAELFPDEVVTQAHVRHLDLPGGRGPLRAHHAGQRPGPHQADHLRPAVAGEPERRDRPGREGGRRGRDRRRRHHRQAVHLRRRRRPQGRRAAEAARGRARHRQGRPRRLQAAVRPRRADVRVLQRRGDGRRRRGRSALHVPHRLHGAARLLAARGLPRPGPRLGRLRAAAEPDRRGPRGLGHHRELAQPEQAAQGQAGLRARASPTRSSRARTSWSSRCSGPRPSSRARSTVERPEIDRGEAWDQAVARGRSIADSKVHGAAPAAYRALDIIAAAKNGDLQRRLRRRGHRPSPT